ncbi:STB5 [[Candida] subhashii]|uniref:STB5 n=1 Tax=[Candida] subhashii TaxID=561895 RepID=A0A8J5UKY9_9ASCO|nr:STB5 [[Candida] subhashii]KAG7662431.1 STB5 [[Candida] subhashii]
MSAESTHSITSDISSIITMPSTVEGSENLVTKFRIKKPSISRSTTPQIDFDKLTSCVRCRKLKKKCSKNTPECLNCDKAGESCTYVPRKKRKSKKGSEEVEEASSSSMSGTRSISRSLETVGIQEYTFVQNNLKSESQVPLNSPVVQSSTVLNPIDARAPDFHSYPKQISKILISAVGINTNSNVSIIPPIIDKELLSLIINAFFLHNYRACPVINKRQFLNQFNKLFENDKVDLDDFDDKFELYIVLAIGSTGLERSGVINREKKISEFFVSKALNHVHNNLSSNDLKNVKYLVLLGLYSFFDPSEFTAWEIMGKVTRLAIHLGLNKAISELEAKNLTPRQVEFRSRLFWSVYMLDRLTCVSLGRPVAISDDDINTPLPVLLDDDHEDIDINHLLLGLRRIEGQILRRVHSVSTHKHICIKNKPKEVYRDEVLSELRTEIDEWYTEAGSINTPTSRVSFHSSIPWYSARYHHLLILLYRPSYLNPTPSPSMLEILGNSCLETLASTYKLYIAKLLPLNWTTLYRFLMVCTTMLYCLCKWTIDLVESKTEICYCIEILQAFGSDWIVAKKCAEVFKQIENKLLEITLTSSGNTDMDNLSRELLGASSSYHEILNVHSVDISFENEFLQTTTS